MIVGPVSRKSALLVTRPIDDLSKHNLWACDNPSPPTKLHLMVKENDPALDINNLFIPHNITIPQHCPLRARHAEFYPCHPKDL